MCLCWVVFMSVCFWEFLLGYSFFYMKIYIKRHLQRTYSSHFLLLQFPYLLLFLLLPLDTMRLASVCVYAGCCIRSFIDVYAYLLSKSKSGGGLSSLLLALLISKESSHYQLHLSLILSFLNFSLKRKLNILTQKSLEIQ